VIFDVPPAAKVADCRANLHALPEPFRSSVSQALEARRPVASASYAASMRQVACGRLVLVGDAAGCCHPVTATGLTVCVRDALRLRDALRETGGDILRALPMYDRLRRAPQRTRLVMARALHETFCAQTPELRLMRDGLREYWLGSTRRRTTSMALLSTADGRLPVMLKELAQVIRCGFGARVSDAWHDGNFSAARMRVLLHLSKRLLRHAGEALRTT
jgi:2-polyprenyl-6-methoxyphenol hydroxylase-like FAD-dependent oxidoreductase